MWNILYWRTTRHCFDLARHHHNDALSFSKPLLLEKNEGELRTRRPRPKPMASTQCLFKVDPKNNGSQHQ